MAVFGITVGTTLSGFLAALAEFGGGICLMLGLLFRPALVLMMGTMKDPPSGPFRETKRYQQSNERK